jgi:hypothetical protein
MNIYEDANLEQRLSAISDQLGMLLLDFLLVSLKKISAEHLIYSEFEECRRPPENQDTDF